MKIGTAQVDLLPGTGKPVPMGGVFKRYYSNSIHDPLCASCLVLDDGQMRIAWISCDLSLIPEDVAACVGQQVEKLTGIAADHVLVSATHTHGGPSMSPDSIFTSPDPDLTRWIADKIVESVQLACGRMKNARMGFGKGTVEKCAANRRYITPSGQSQMHPRRAGDRLLKEGPEDKEIQVIWFEDDDSRLLSAMVNFGAHPDMSYARDYVTADYPGVVRETIQAIFGKDVTVVFLLGACGNVGVYDYDDPNWSRGLDGIRRIGRILGGKAIQIISSGYAVQTEGTRLAMERAVLDIPYKDMPPDIVEQADRIWAEIRGKPVESFVGSYSVVDLAMVNRVRLLEQYKKIGPCAPVELSAVKIGDVYLTANPAEYFVEYQLRLKERFKNRKLILVEKTNGNCLYVPTRTAVALGGYEVLSNKLAPQAGEMIFDASAALIEKLPAL